MWVSKGISDRPTIMPGMDFMRLVDGIEYLQKGWDRISGIVARSAGFTYKIFCSRSTRLLLANSGISNSPCLISLYS